MSPGGAVIRDVTRGGDRVPQPLVEQRCEASVSRPRKCELGPSPGLDTDGSLALAVRLDQRKGDMIDPSKECSMADFPVAQREEKERL